MTPKHQQLARQLAGLFSTYSQVEAVALGGSLSSGAATDSQSDIDLYVFTTALLPLAERQAIVQAAGGASRANMDLTFWDLGDEWFDAASGIEVDIIYWDTRWIDEQIERVLGQHQASLGYTTCFWHTLRQAQALFDRNGWLAALQARCDQPYPEALRRAIIAKNLPVLRAVIPSYLHQIEKAVRRADLVSINHRVAALLASYFDILFALNRLPHPGEKRLLAWAQQRCPRQPPQMAIQVQAVLQAAGAADPALVEHCNALIDGIEALAGQEK
jgi:hypothetical protein